MRGDAGHIDLQNGFCSPSLAIASEASSGGNMEMAEHEDAGAEELLRREPGVVPQSNRAPGPAAPAATEGSSLKARVISGVAGHELAVLASEASISSCTCAVTPARHVAAKMLWDDQRGVGGVGPESLFRLLVGGPGNHVEDKRSGTHQ